VSERFRRAVRKPDEGCRCRGKPRQRKKRHSPCDNLRERRSAVVRQLFAPSDRWPISCHADKLFTRIRGVIKDGFADPDFGPSAVAAEAGISLRYLQKNATGFMDRIAGALANLGFEVCDQTVGNVLRRHALLPAPERKRTTTWSAFIRIYLALLAGTDFLTAEVLTLRGWRRRAV
jgi:hypothetical protein